MDAYESMLCWMLALAAGCSSELPPSPERSSSLPTVATASAAGPGSAAVTPVAEPLDANAIEQATTGKSEVMGDVVKVTFPRTDVEVAVDGWTMPPFMGLTSWAAFSPAKKSGIEAMVMGDLVLFEDEVSDVMLAALENGLEVTALHNHFFYDNPRVYFMHVGGEGSVAQLTKGVRAALDAEGAVRKKSAQPGNTFGGAPLAAKSSIDAAKVEAATGRKPAEKDGMAKLVVGRSATMRACGCSAGKAMGVNTWAAFAGTNEDALVDGDFAVIEDELQPVLKSLRRSGIHVVAIHHHMTGEEPRILFVHYWGRGSVAVLGAAIKQALALTKSDAS